MRATLAALALVLVFLATGAAPSPTPSPEPSASPSPAPFPRNAKLVFPNPDRKIAQIVYGPEPEVAALPHGDEIKGVAFLDGQYNRPEWNLLWNNLPIDTAKGKFHIIVPLTAEATMVELMAVGPLGEIERQRVGIFFPSWNRFKDAAKEKPPKTFYLNPGLNLTYVSYQDNRIADVSGMFFTGKVSFTTLLFPPRWDFGASAYLTLAPITSNAPSTMRFLGLNVRMGYVVPQVADPWRLSILGGIYYTTMFVSPATYGFTGMTGPQLFPVLRRTFKNRDVAVAYLKFSPVTDGVSLSFDNREYAIGGAYSRPLADGHSLGATLDIASFQLKIRRVVISSMSISLGASYGF